jgi:hypothetical protein
MGEPTAFAGTGTSTVVIASLQIARAVTEAALRTQLQQAGATPRPCMADSSRSRDQAADLCWCCLALAALGSSSPTTWIGSVISRVVLSRSVVALFAIDEMLALNAAMSSVARSHMPESHSCWI